MRVAKEYLSFDVTFCQDCDWWDEYDEEIEWCLECDGEAFHGVFYECEVCNGVYETLDEAASCCVAKKEE